MLWRDRKSGPLLDFDVSLRRRVGALPIKMKFDFDFLKDRYDYELKRKDQITAALTLPVGILIALGTVMVAMAQSFSYTGGYLTWFFLPFLVSSAVAFLLCVVCISFAYHRQKTWYLQPLSKLQKTRETWRGFYKEIYRRAPGDSSLSDEQLFQEADDLFQDELQTKIIEAADHNKRTNDVRSNVYLYWARVVMFVSLTLTAIAGISYVVDQVRF